MSVQMFGAVILCGPRDRTQFCVMSALANNADDFGFAFPAIATIAADSRCDEKTVKRALVALERTGWLYIARKVINGKGNCYILNCSRMGVRVSPESRRSPVFTRLLKLYGDAMTPIFAPEKSGDMDTFSGDNPQPLQGTLGRSQGTFSGGSGDTACPPNRNNRKSLNRKGTVSELEPPTLPAQAGGTEVEEHNPESTGGRGESPEPAERPELSGHTPVPRADSAEMGVSEDRLRYWERFRLALKPDIGTRGHRNFSQIRPGENDFDVCFRDWWFLGLRRDGTVWTFLTHAADEPATEAGLAKYHPRLTATVRHFFPIPAQNEIRFVLQRPATINPAA